MLFLSAFGGVFGGPVLAVWVPVGGPQSASVRFRYTLRSGPSWFPGLGAGLRLRLLAHGGVGEKSHDHPEPHLASYRLCFV